MIRRPARRADRLIAAASRLLVCELLPLDIGPEFLRHLRRGDRLVAEHGGQRVVAAIEVDGIAAECRLLVLCHPLASVWNRCVALWWRPSAGRPADCHYRSCC